MFNVYSIENQNFYLNNSIISGIQNLDISYENNIQPSLAIADSNLNYFASNPVIGNLNLSYILSSNDRFISYTGSDYFNGKIEYGTKYFNFSSGYLTNYNLNYRLGEYPLISVASLILGEIGNISGISSYEPQALNNFNPGDNCYVDLDLDSANFNRLEAFNISINIPREPIYTIGNYLPDNVIIKYPVNISLNFEFSMSDYNQEKVTNIFTGIINKNLALSFKKYNTDEKILTFNLSNLINSDTELSYNIQDDAKLSMNFQTYILSGI